MTASSGTGSPSPQAVHDEAAASAVRHTGPTADRYYSAVLRYLNAIAGDHTAAHHAHPHPAEPAAMLVGDVMTHQVIAVPATAGFKEIVATLARNRVRAVPVIDDQHKVLGVVSASDLLNRAVAGPGGAVHTGRAHHGSHIALTATQLMSAPAVTTRTHAPIVDAARTAAHARVRTLPVVDSHGVLVGIVSQGDLLRVFLREDDDIRGEIEAFAHAALHPRPVKLTVEVREGVVTLDGKLERQLQVTQLVNHVRTVSGVVDIDNRLTARFDDRYFPAPHDTR